LEVPTLPAFIERITNPSPEVVSRMGIPKDQLETAARNLRMALLRMDGDGDLAGMFHKETTPGVFDPVPLLVLDCSGVNDEAALMVITLINFFTVHRNAREGAAKFHHVIHDEAWDLASYPGFVESTRRAFKVGRSDGYGFSNTLIAHHWSNLVRSGHTEVNDLLSDSSLIILYRQDSKEIETSASALDLTDTEVEISKILPEGNCLFKFRDMPAIWVRMIAFDNELPLLKTDSWVHGTTELKRALDIAPAYA
jgi:hypothetical protein